MYFFFGGNFCCNIVFEKAKHVMVCVYVVKICYQNNKEL